ncbi:DUF805 domain-containing protein [Agromyces larvae]|uniref:DUF805 domain-containing protein n=1 Tax=Agromyces larvae TaxID=2929802 RepID=A0ABY4BX53_9MICO|nr:DUF805 domain-containing protein [Agromyces larvae]UOE43494.1 DUF805 domain-containing protein [Agromyces larvae]
MSYAPAPTATAAPLSAPLYGASFGEAIKRFFTKYATFTGRASRSEFWWAYLGYVIVVTVLYVLALVGGFSGATVDPLTGVATLGPLFWVAWAVLGLFGLGTIVPFLAITWRRLHDTNRSGGFFFLSLIPFVGSIILLVFLVLDSDPAGARFDV